MKKWTSIGLLLILTLALCACAGSVQEQNDDKQTAGQWDCSVESARNSGDNAYIITYSDTEVTSASGTLTFQNPNDFAIVVHLRDIKTEEEEQTIEIAAGGVSTLDQIEKETAYAVGCHADVDEGTEIKLMVYDGEIADGEL